jgi:hypothetical protein
VRLALHSVRFETAELLFPPRADLRLPPLRALRPPLSSLLSIKVTFRESNGDVIKTVEGNDGDDLLTVAHEYDIDLEGSFRPQRHLRRNARPYPAFLVLAGACEGSIACSTCHIVLSQEQYDALPEPSDEENDMLDLAFGLTDT